MDRPVAARTARRLTAYALVAALSIGAAVAPSVSEARAPEERPKSMGNSAAAALNHPGAIDQWFAIGGDEIEAEPSSIRSWWAPVYERLLGLKAAISLALSHAWKWSHSKPDNTCS